MTSIEKVESELNFEKGDTKHERKGHTYMQWLYATLASTTLFTYGIQAGWVSPMASILQSDQSPTGYPLSDSELSWVGSALALTATFGVILYAYIADAYGRKFGVIAIAVPQALCWGVKLFASNTTMLVIARVIGGIPSGGCFNLVPMYIKEISQDNIRGAVVSLSLLMQNFGLLAVYIMGNYLGYYTVLYVVGTVPILTTVLMVFAPESPAYLVKEGRYEEAAKTTAALRGLSVDDKGVQHEVQTMKSEEEHWKSLPKITFLNIFKNKAWRRGFTYIGLVITAQALNGTFSIVTFASSILAASGSSASPELQALVVPVLMICGSVFSMACVERVGRKVILVSTYVLTSVSFVVLASTQLIMTRGGSPPTWLVTAAIAGAVWAYAAGITPMCYVIMSEMFSFQVRAKLIGCIVTYAWFTSSIQLVIFGPVANTFGIYTMFFIFAGVNVFGAIVGMMIPETKGKTVGEIEAMLTGK